MRAIKHLTHDEPFWPSLDLTFWRLCWRGSFGRARAVTRARSI